MRQLNQIEVTNARITNLVAKQDRTVGYLANQLPPANLSPWQPTLPGHEFEPPMGCLPSVSTLRAGRLAVASGSFAGGRFTQATATSTILSKRSKRMAMVNGTVSIHSTNRHRHTADHDYRSHDRRDDSISTRGERTTLTGIRIATTLVGK